MTRRRRDAQAPDQNDPKRDEAVPELRDRVRELRRVTAAELQDNAGNWRVHPEVQRQALRDVMDHLGICGALLAYESERCGGALVLIDGHLRRGDYPDQTWPVLVLDVTDLEADTLLATHDAITALAVGMPERLAALLERVGAREGISPRLLEVVGMANGVGSHLQYDGSAKQSAAMQHDTIRVELRAMGEFEGALAAVKAVLEANPEWGAYVGHVHRP